MSSKSESWECSMFRIWVALSNNNLEEELLWWGAGNMTTWEVLRNNNCKFNYIIDNSNCNSFFEYLLWAKHTKYLYNWHYYTSFENELTIKAQSSSSSSFQLTMKSQNLNPGSLPEVFSELPSILPPELGVFWWFLLAISVPSHSTGDLFILWFFVSIKWGYSYLLHKVFARVKWEATCKPHSLVPGS